ncbi:MAG: hypothetical protein OEY85_02085 [Rhodospirillales bacterium]|nr:hypothetical protein [Rhodospirillales bacterium]
MFNILSFMIEWTVRLTPAAALFSLFFVMEADLRGLGVLGLLPLIFAFRDDCPACSLRKHPGAKGPGWQSWPGH